MATTAASEATPWRAGAASVLSSGFGVEVGGAAAIVDIGAGVGQIYIFTTPHDVDSHRVPENALDG